MQWYLMWDGYAEAAEVRMAKAFEKGLHVIHEVGDIHSIKSSCTQSSIVECWTLAVPYRVPNNSQDLRASKAL